MPTPATSFSPLRSGAGERRHDRDEHSSVGFKSPLLSLIVARAKLFDMRLADDPSTRHLVPGSIISAYQSDSTGSFRQCLRVTAVAAFPSPAAAYSSFDERGLGRRMFPWCNVSTPAAARDYFLGLFNRPAVQWHLPGSSAVRVFTVEPCSPGGYLPANQPRPFMPPSRKRAPSPAPIPEHDDVQLPAEPPDAPPPPDIGRWLAPSSRQPVRCLPHVPTPHAPPSSSGPARRLPPYLPLTVAALDASTALSADLPSGLVERVVSDARRHARSRGSLEVTARDLASAAARYAGQADPYRQPAAELPVHFDEVVERLAVIKRRATPFSGGGPGPSMVPTIRRRARVLVLGESSAVVARMFTRAGADAATCDLMPSEDPDIPHFLGDASRIADLGWDLVIAHPPCTYLSNAGVSWLTREPDRWEKVVNNADVFRRMYHARAPFVAIENAKMHRYARDLVGVRPTQYVNPWQHGTGHSKVTALYLRNLPTLQPTCLMEGREQAMARLPPSPDRGSVRSRTYLGIAAAMALQWMPVLLEHVASLVEVDSLTASHLVDLARSEPITQCLVAFTRNVSSSKGQPQDVVTTADGTILTVPFEPELTDARAATNQWALNDVLLPHSWRTSLTEAMRVFPTGHRTLTTFTHGRLRMNHVWCLDVSHLGLGAQQLPLQRHPTSTHDSIQWSNLTEALPWPTATILERMSYYEVITHPVATPLVSPPSYEPPIDPPAIPRSARTAQPPVTLAAVLNPSTGTSPLNPRDVDAARARRLSGRPRPYDEIIMARATSRGVTPVVHPPPFQQPPLTLPPERLVQLDSDIADLLPSSRPWLIDPPKVSAPPSPAPSLIRRRHGRWRVWQANPAEGNSAPMYGWQPLPSQLHDQLEAHLRPTTSSLMPIPETTPFSSDAAAVVAVAGVGHAMHARHTLSWEGLRELWELRAPPLDARHLGLGADRADLTEPPTAKLSLQRRLEHLRRSHTQWLPATPPSERVEPDDLEEPPPVQRPTGGLQSAPPTTTFHRQVAPVVLPPSTAPSTPPPAAATTDREEIALTPRTIRLDPTHSLYIKNLRLLTHSQTRKPNHQSLEVRCAIANRPLCDSGAGPSVLTTGFLNNAPSNLQIVRNHHAEVGPINEASGQPMVTQGTAKLTFDLDGTICEHDFVVALGEPLLILGNDFLDPRRAVIRLNTNGQGDGVLELTSVSSSGRPISHSAAVSTSPRSLVGPVISPAAPVTVASVSPPLPSISSEPRPVTTDDLYRPSPPDPDVDPVMKVEPITACDLATKALADGTIKLGTTEYALYAQRAIPLRRRAVTTVRLRAPQAIVDMQHTTCFVDHLPQRLSQDLGSAPCVIPRSAVIEDGYIELQILNLSYRDTTLPCHLPVALLDVEYTVHGNLDPDALPMGDPGYDYYAALSPELQAVVNEVKIDPDKRLSEAQRLLVKQLVSKHVMAFALDPKSPTKTHLMNVELPLMPGASPHRHAPSRLGEEGRKIVDKHVEEMETRGIIRKSNSAWGSRVVLVSKKDGSIRFCVDYRDLNSKLQLQDSPLPLCVEAIDRLSSGQGHQSSLFLSTLDLASGFWCLPIKESDKGLTAFVTHRQKYEFNYLPFGVQSGPSYMCRLMDAALQGLAWETCMPYLDDVGVWSTGVGDTPEDRESASFDQMMTRLEAVFERLKWAGLSMKASKCLLFATSAEYLGHIIGRDGLRMDPKKISTVASINPTSINTIEKVRSFLGLCSYYRRFITQFAHKAAPLHALTKDGVDVPASSQRPESQAAIIALITAITTEPVLATPRNDREFIVKTDAANTEGIGGVLSQKDDEGRERVIAYYGRTLTIHERRYTVTEIELLAALESIKHWRPYLWGRKFHLVIDHSALRWLHTMRDTLEGGPASRCMRWIIRLQEYQFDIEHKPGLIHKDADGVSRLAAPIAVTVAPIRRSAVQTARRVQLQQRDRLGTPDRESILRSYFDNGAPDLATIREEQEADPLCIALHRYLEDGYGGEVNNSTELQNAIWMAREVCSLTGRDGQPRRRYELVDGVIYRRRTPSQRRPVTMDSSATLVPFVPEALRPALLTAFHDRFGHPSHRRLADILLERYYWPRLEADAATHVAECHECTLSKPPARRPRNLRGPDVGQYPFDVLFADILSMTETHDYDKDTGAGASKLLVFVDSLSRWVEAIPCHKDPTSEQILDIFMTHIVARYGAPRRVITDAGSNLSSRLCEAVMEKSGVDLRSSAAEHHEAVGTVERFQQTLVRMTRASNEGGSHWVDHLPFLLMSYRATPHRVLGASPALLLFGHELRLPNQTTALLDETDESYTNLEYATRLHRRLIYAWAAARQTTCAAQGATIADTSCRSNTEVSFKEGDRVARLLHGHANKLEYIYAGPYRVEKVLSDGRCQLRDLENNHIETGFNVSNLRAYRTHVDAEELQPDEYVVDALLKRRTVRGQRQYLVHWRGYPRSAATWELPDELGRRCADLLAAFDQEQDNLALPRSLRGPLSTPAAQPPPLQVHPPPATVDTSDGLGDLLPHSAHFERGKWFYNRRTPTPRGHQNRKLPSSNFTPSEIASDHFVALRHAALATSLTTAPITVAVLERHPAFTPDALSCTQHAAKVWFTRRSSAAPPLAHRGAYDINHYELLSYVRIDARHDKPQYDTFGGRMDLRDDKQYNRCGLRELREEAKLPRQWHELVGTELSAFPDGRDLVELVRPTTQRIYRQAIWVVPIPAELASSPVFLTANGALEAVPRSLRWRPARSVFSNLETFATFHPLSSALEQILETVHTEISLVDPSTIIMTI